MRARSSVCLMSALIAVLVTLGTMAHAAPAPWRIVGTYPLPGEKFTGRVVIYFDEDIAPLKNPDGSVLTPLTVVPNYPSEINVGANFISLISQAPVSGDYSINVSRDLHSVSGRKLPEDQRLLRFSTVAVELERTMARVENGQILLYLSFNAWIDLTLLKAHLSIVDAQQQPVAFELTQGALSAQYVLSLPQGTALPVSVTVRRDLKDPSGKLPMEHDQSFIYPDPTPLEVRACAWDSNADKNRFHLEFNSNLSPAVLQRHLRIRNTATNEEIPFRIITTAERSTQEITLTGNIGDVASFHIEVAKELSDVGTRVLGTDYATDLPRPASMGAAQAKPLQVTYHHWQTDPSDGLVLQLEFNGAVDAAALEQHLQFAPALENLKVLPGYYRSLKVTGDWHSKQQYELTLSPGLKDTQGRFAISEPYSQTLQATPFIQYFNFAYGGKVYFPRRGTGQMTVEACNMKEAGLKLFWLFPSNLPMAVDFGDMESGGTYGGFNEQYARLINEKKVAFPDSPDRKSVTTVNVADLLSPDKKGVFTLQGPGREYGKDTKVIVWTDIGVVGHWLDGEVAVFAHNLFTLEPLPGAKVSVWSSKNQVMGTALTDDHGVAVLRDLDKGLGKPHVAVVETENDSTFLILKPDAKDPVAFNEQMPRYDYEGYDAFLYADRNLYRPGETVHARWLVRTHYGDAAPSMPLVASVVNPKGTELSKETVTLSALGSGNQDIVTKQSWLTGRYELRLTVPGASAALGTCTFNIEDFVPHRIKTEVKTDPAPWASNTPHAIHVSAQNLFGTPAANLKCEATLILKRGEFKSEQWKEFRFGNDSEFTSEVRSLGEEQTNDEGQADFSFTYTPQPKVTFPLRAIVRGEVAEAGGRGVAATTDTLILPSDTLIGAGVSNKAGAQNTIVVHAAAIRPDETPAALASVQVILEREEWSYNVRHYQDYNEPAWSKSLRVVETRDVSLQNGRGDIEFTLEDCWSRYRVRVSSKETPLYSTISFYARWNGIDITASPRPSLIKLALNKEVYQPGEEAELRVESPFDGRGIVTVQAGQIQNVLPLEVKDGVGVVKMPITVQQYPNVWAEVTLAHQIKPGSSGVHPYSSTAMISIPVTDLARKVEVTYPGLPEEIRPNQTVQIVLETKNTSGAPVSAEVTLAAVDEGIHDILEYTAPDPFSWFQRARRPDYRRADYYDRVAYDFLEASIGGDAIAKRLGKGTPGIGENWIKPVALWSGAVTTDAQGKAAVSMAVPEFDGQLRLVAVAVSQNATGAKSAPLFVRRPYILRTSMPRFALPGDKFSCLAVLFNTTKTAVKAKVKWSSTGTLVPSQGGMELNLPAGAQERCSGAFAAGNVIGQGAIAWDADITGPDGAVLEHLHQDAPLPVRPSSAYETRRELFVVQPGETRTFSNTDFTDNEQLETSIVVGANPLLRLKKALEFLVHYPYGCVEQTTSSCFPAYLVRKSNALAGGDLKEAKQMEGYLKAGIERLFSMQTSGGGLSYWPGATEPYDYGSVYACHFLTLVHRDHEIAVPEGPYKALRQYVRGLAEGELRKDPSVQFSDYHTRAYACYVLSLEPDLKAMELIQRFDTITLPRSTRYLLAAALALNTQDPKRVAEYMKAAPYQVWDDRERGGTLNSPVRNVALELLAMLQIDKNALEASQKADVLITYLEGQHYTTQEVAFAASALGLYLSALNINAGMATAAINGSGGEKTIKGTEVFEHKYTGPGPQYIVQNTGTSSVFVNVTTGGVPLRSEAKAEAEGIKISRAFRDAGGADITNDNFAHGNEVVVDVTIECKNETENLILSDLLPAALKSRTRAWTAPWRPRQTCLRRRPRKRIRTVPRRRARRRKVRATVRTGMQRRRAR